jgi:Zn-dependent oligopeptidase
LLNYTNFAERALEDKMAKNIDNVEKLLNDLTQRITEQGSSEMDKLV